ncbi:Spherulation-specific family 4-domain-containing protein [Halenospora varia]|nr:Spherulation-specific family 4-domain-containing protein [Halenospora varia]
MSYGTTKPKRRSTVCSIPKYIVWFLLGFAILVTVIPITVMLNRKKKDSPPKSIKTNPQVSFTVVVNLASGPGGSSSPDVNYTKEIPKPNQHTNVRTVGYVLTNYANRPLPKALQDIAVYSSWFEKRLYPALE